MPPRALNQIRFSSTVSNRAGSLCADREKAIQTPSPSPGPPSPLRSNQIPERKNRLSSAQNYILETEVRFQCGMSLSSGLENAVLEWFWSGPSAIRYKVGMRGGIAG